MQLAKGHARKTDEADGRPASPGAIAGGEELSFVLIRKYLAFVLLLTGIVAGYSRTHTEINDKVEYVERRQKEREDSTERRLAKLESGDGDKVGIIVGEHTKQIDALKDMVAKDHDLLVRVVTLIENRDKRGNAGTGG